MAYVESMALNALYHIDNAFDYIRIHYDLNISEYDDNMNKIAMIVGYFFLFKNITQLFYCCVINFFKGLYSIYNYCSKYTIIIKKYDKKKS